MPPGIPSLFFNNKLLVLLSDDFSHYGLATCCHTFHDVNALAQLIDVFGLDNLSVDVMNLNDIDDCLVFDFRH